MKTFEPKVDPAPQSRGDLLHHLQQFSRPKSLQKAGILRPQPFGLPNQPGPGAYRLPVLEALAYPIPAGCTRSSRADLHANGSIVYSMSTGTPQGQKIHMVFLNREKSVRSGRLRPIRALVPLRRQYFEGQQPPFSFRQSFGPGPLDALIPAETGLLGQVSLVVGKAGSIELAG